jgi:6-phosphogluconolactonase (cycloisomerase 2 family)
MDTTSESNPNPTVASTQQSLLAEAQQQSVPSFLVAFLQQPQGQALDVSPRSRALDAANVLTGPRDSRTLADTYPTYTSIGVNLQTDEVVLQDNNLWSTRVFNRLDNTPAGAEMTQPKRVIQGRTTLIQYNNGLYIDQKNGDIYSVESDTGDRMTVFTKDANGNVAPKRELHTIHRAYAMTVDEERQEIYITVEYPPKILVYRKEASGDEQPIREIKGDHTLLQTPHGIALDLKNRLIFVDNWGQEVDFDGSDSMTGCCRQQTYETGNVGTGKFNAPSITVYPLDAKGDTRPLRVIQGDRTQMNWPGNLSLDPDTGDLYVANDVNQSVLVFTGTTSLQGNVAPTRVIKGNNTGLRNPTGVFVDTKHQELWVANLGNSSGTAYPLKADGNVPPLRTVRSAPAEHQSLTFGRTAAVAYDPNRQEILVPN